MLYELVLDEVSAHSEQTGVEADVNYLDSLHEYCDVLDDVLMKNIIEEDDVSVCVADDGTVHIVFFSPAFEFVCSGCPFPSVLSKAQSVFISDAGTDRGLEFEFVFPSLWH